jgi:hypothetical protein
MRKPKMTFEIEIADDCYKTGRIIKVDASNAKQAFRKAYPLCIDDEFIMYISSGRKYYYNCFNGFENSVKKY